MTDSEPRKIDWVNLPPGVEEVSLWQCLHDGGLLSCRTSPEDGTANLELEVNHLRKDGEDDLKFLLALDGVTSVRASFHLPVAEGKWRQESFSWVDFETALATDPLEIMDADFATAGDETTLRLAGFLDGDIYDRNYCEVFLRGRSLTASRSDGVDFSIDAFIKLGREYWESFGNDE